MKLLASLALGTATFLAATFALAAPAAAGDDVTVGVRLGPLCVGICIGGGHRHHHGYDHGHADYDGDYDDGFYAHREDYYHQNYDRRDPYDDYAEAREDGYAGYRRRYAGDYGEGDHHRRYHDGDDD
jgi:hypothetical protein